MRKIKLMIGLSIAASLLSFAPVAEAVPIAAGIGAARPGAAKTMSGSESLIVKTVTAAGAAHRSSRRTARRVNRRHSY